MKIVHVYKDYWPILGGIEGNIQQIAERQVARGHDVTVLVTNPSDLPTRETLNGVNIMRAHRLATVASTPLSITFPFLLRSQKPAIAHLHFPYPLGDVSQLLFGRTHPYVITYHSDIVKQKQILRFYGPILKRVLKRARRIMPTSANYLHSSPWLKPLAHNCTPVPLGIDPLPWLPVNSEQLTVNSRDALPLIIHNSQFTINNSLPKLLFMGRHRYYKGLDTLIRAMPQIEAQLIVGGDGPMTDEWKALAQELGVADKVVFIGRVKQEDMAGLYGSADIFTFPSNARAEAFGIVLMEAMVSGLPCVTTELGTGTSFIVQHEETGLVVPPKNPDALAAAINALLANPDMRQQMGEAGRQRILSQFTIDHMVDRIETIYNEVLKATTRD